MLASSGVWTHIIGRAAIYRSLVRLLRRKVTLPQDKTQPYDWGIFHQGAPCWAALALTLILLCKRRFRFWIFNS